jgi:hypothetical protein
MFIAMVGSGALGTTACLQFGNRSNCTRCVGSVPRRYSPGGGDDRKGIRGPQGFWHYGESRASKIGLCRIERRKLCGQHSRKCSCCGIHRAGSRAQRRFGQGPRQARGEGKIHGALVSGFKSIYGFSSDEQGIRHALLDKGAPAVDGVDAIFMLGACSAFVSCLINKSRAVGLLT